MHDEKMLQYFDWEGVAEMVRRKRNIEGEQWRGKGLFRREDTLAGALR